MKIIPITAGLFKCDGGAIFGVVPKRVWQKRYPCDADNFCQLAMRCLLIDTGKRLILIDSGAGNKQLEYLKYYQVEQVIDFEETLQQAGYSCANVTDVILTHLHFDHCGGCTYYTDKKLKTTALAFPNAKHWVGRQQWENFLNPNVREGDSYFPENMLPIEQAGKLQLIEHDEKLCDEIELRLFNGHTVGQIAVFIKSEKQTLVYAGDIIPVAAALPVAWISAFDTNPLTSMQEKEQLLHECAENRYTLFFEHDAYTQTCMVNEINGKFRVCQA